MNTLEYFPSMYPKGDVDKPSGIGRFLCADSEAIGLLPSLRYNDPTCIHTICITDMFSGEQFIFFDCYDERDPNTRIQLDQEDTQDGYLYDALDMLMEAEAVCMQNLVGYDGLAFEYVFPDKWKFNYLERRGKNREHSDYFPMKMMDTLVISQLLNPDRRAPAQAFALGRGNVSPHSIEAHGMRIGRHKQENEDWSHLTDHMLHRCSEDTEIGKDMFFWLMNGEWVEHLKRGRNSRTGLGIDSALRMETQCAISVARQAQRGFRLDTKTAWSDWLQIGKEMEEVFTKIDPYIFPRITTESMKNAHVLNRCVAFAKNLTSMMRTYPKTSPNSEYESPYSEMMNRFGSGDVGWLHDSLQSSLFNREEARIGKRTTVWAITKASGDYNAAVKGDYPEMVGNVNDTPDPLVAGAYTPIVWEKIGLGNLDYIKQNVLYPRGWLGITFNKNDEKWMTNEDENPDGEPPLPWSGKIDELSLEAWKARDGNVPEWLVHIVDWYVLRSRRSQILNVKDMKYYSEHKEFPKQKDGTRHCKGLLAKAYSKEYRMEAWEYFIKMGSFPDSEDEEWRVPAVAFSLGTNTFRMRHKFVVNIPSRGLHPLRHLFIAGKGKMILGCDGSGLELRMLAHFMADAIYTAIVLDGDIHTHNQTLAGLPVRDIAKTFIYAFLYGSGIKNLAKVCGVSVDDMDEKVAKFKRDLPSLSNLIDNCEKAGKKYGYLQAVDGRWGRIRKQNGKILIHTVLNVLLQMTGSLAMKYGLCFAENKMIKEGVALDDNGFPMYVANVHDEVQMEVPADEVEEYLYTIKECDWKEEEKIQYFDADGRMYSAPSKMSGKGTGTLILRRLYHRAGAILAETMKETGEFLRMRIPLAGEYKIGNSWHDTH